MIRLIVTDLDGTLLANHDTIHPDNALALRATRARGVGFAVATGRSAVSCGMLLADHGFPDAHIIAVNGCQVLERPFAPPVLRRGMDKGAAARVMAVFQSHGLGGCLFTENAVVYTSEEMRRRQEGARRDKSRYLRLRALGRETLAGEEAVRAALETFPLKAYCVCGPGEERAFAEAKAACARVPGVSLTSSWADNFEVMPQGVDKGTALRALAERLGVGREEIMAFGDYENDLPMLTWAGLGFAMENAQEGVKRKVGRVAGPCGAGGVARAIEEWVLGRQ